jgi:predicted nucleotidyltransferase
MSVIPIAIDQDRLEALCRKHGIIELSLFGSILRGDFRSDSDIDVLVQFQDGKTLTLDSYVEIGEELSTQFDGRPIDLVEMRRLADPYRRHEILRTREIIYAR